MYKILNKIEMILILDILVNRERKLKRKENWWLGKKIKFNGTRLK